MKQDKQPKAYVSVIGTDLAALHEAVLAAKEKLTVLGNRLDEVLVPPSPVPECVKEGANGGSAMHLTLYEEQYAIVQLGEQIDDLLQRLEL